MVQRDVLMMSRARMCIDAARRQYFYRSGCGISDLGMAAVIRSLVDEAMARKLDPNKALGPPIYPGQLT